MKTNMNMNSMNINSRSIKILHSMEPAPLPHSLEPVDIPLCVKSNGADGSESGLLNSAAMVRRRMPMGRSDCFILSSLVDDFGQRWKWIGRILAGDRETYLPIWDPSMRQVKVPRYVRVTELLCDQLSTRIG